ncbi:MAG TPA: hypothetical protein VKA76_05320 [Gammaproteobacteria bacterium]|nr:hypothetical protein [Gammaproteobacteria bacterium]
MDENTHLWSLLPLLIATFPLTLICYQVARQRNRRFGLWTVFSVIPVVNYFVLLYLLGSRRLRSEGRQRRLQAIAQQIGR